MGRRHNGALRPRRVARLYRPRCHVIWSKPLDERPPSGGRSLSVIWPSSGIQRWECAPRRWRRRRRNARLTRPFIARFMSMTSVLGWTGRFECVASGRLALRRRKRCGDTTEV
jgi:hypothetical protein